jgi:hypothetical protein
LENVVYATLLGGALAMLAACAAAPRPVPPKPAQLPCTPAPELTHQSPAQLVAQLGRQAGTFVLAAGAPYVCVCGARTLGGDTEQRKLGGDSEKRALGGDSEKRALGGDSEQRALGGDSEKRALGGDSEKRALGGDSEKRALGGDSEKRALGGDSEKRALGGGSEALTCSFVPGCGGYVVSGRGPLQFIIDGKFVDARDRCVE